MGAGGHATAVFSRRERKHSDKGEVRWRGEGRGFDNGVMGISIGRPIVGR